ncbi:MAG: hypothetical protein J4224_04125 [Candidatus Diapherotrites archaeon]|uniref:VapC9 PIN-like domain-containing protein n=1 Tax=Candidatus Iainarchaeum sp. TaxID=3101447 RepID=A0A7J4ISD5_9ARCH|nr:MAG: PilT protein [archaeon GW2011_AR10]MBS3059582.1 hypothetical protein [Candidatus Diapherotrites archaeon]HIH08372.1 hypothetical protein [Candidatus Diapherotrites archaeon]
MASASRVALDSSMLLTISEFKVDVFEEAKKLLGRVDFVVPSKVKEEIERIAGRGLKERKSVKVAEQAMRQHNVQVVEAEGKNADEALLSLSANAVIATNDRELKRKILEKNGKVMFLRKRQFIELSS